MIAVRGDALVLDDQDSALESADPRRALVDDHERRVRMDGAADRGRGRRGMAIAPRSRRHPTCANWTAMTSGDPLSCWTSKKPSVEDPGEPAVLDREGHGRPKARPRYVPGSSGAEPATSSRDTAGDGELDGEVAEATAVDGVTANEVVADGDGDGAGPQAARSTTVAAIGIQRLGTREPYSKLTRGRQAARGGAVVPRPCGILRAMPRKPFRELNDPDPVRITGRRAEGRS